MIKFTKSRKVPRHLLLLLAFVLGPTALVAPVPRGAPASFGGFDRGARTASVYVGFGDAGPGTAEA